MNGIINLRNYFYEDWLLTIMKIFRNFISWYFDVTDISEISKKYR